MLVQQFEMELSMPGTLRRHPTNGRYFTDDTGRAILLAGAHVWNNLQDMSPTDPVQHMDFEVYLDWLEARGHNFIRLWRWELPFWDTVGAWKSNSLFMRVAPHPWLRTGPGNAIGGGAKFDLGKFDETYFRRLRTRCRLAQERGIYVSIMLFEGWALQTMQNAWIYHPFNPLNNINRIDGDLDKTGKGLGIYTGRSPEILAIQQTYVRNVLETVNDLDNVLFEISNENHPPSKHWQYGMIEFIRECEASMPKQHPVGMTFQQIGGNNDPLFASPADWISPGEVGGQSYINNPPPADGSKVILSDTDHLWGVGGDIAWVWRTVLRGINPLFMDCYDHKVLQNWEHEKDMEAVRRTMGYAVSLSRRADFGSMVPRGDLASSGYCLANPGMEYVVWVPAGTAVELDLRPDGGKMTTEWLDVASGEVQPGGKVQSGEKRKLVSIFKGDSVVHLRTI
jgi:hypothetical protein